MSRKNTRVKAAEDLATSAKDKVAPLAQAAADKLAPLAQAAADKVQPLAHQAADAVSPYAHQAAEKVAPYAHQAAEIIEPYAHSAADKLAPYAKNARKHGTQVAHDAAEKLGPRVEDARDRLQHDLLPGLADRLSDLAQNAASSPAAIEAQKRSRAAAAALRGELILPEDEPKKKRWLLRIGVVTALGGLAFFLVKRFLGGHDSDWQSARPTPYSSTTTTEPAEARSGSAAADAPPTAPGSSDSPAPGASVVADHDSVYEIAPDAKDVAAKNATEHAAKHADAAPAHAADEASDDADHGRADTNSTDGKTDYGRHSFVGAEPPEGFTIKANERSKKYHLPDSAGYGRTQTEVWFDSAEAAEAAGFVKATH